MVETNLIGGLAGGLLIGVSSVLLLLGSGRIAGISGILGGLYGNWMETDRKWRLVFLLGLLSGAGVVAIMTDGLALHFQAEGIVLVVAGLLVGFGTRLGGGCTSGHGVCGLARRSARSLTATVIFIAVAMITVFIIRHLLK